MPNIDCSGKMEAVLRKPGFSINEILNHELSAVGIQSKSFQSSNPVRCDSSDARVNLCESSVCENYEKYLFDNRINVKNMSDMNFVSENFYPQIAYYYPHQPPAFIESPTALAPNGMLPVYVDKCGNPLNAGYPLPLTAHPYATQSTFHPFFVPANAIGNAKRKGGQIRFTTQQTKSLESQFNNNQYLSAQDRKQLAIKLSLSDRQVKTWFQNRRAKWRRTNNVGTDSGRYQPNHVQNQYSKTNNIRLNCMEQTVKDPN